MLLLSTYYVLYYVFGNILFSVMDDIAAFTRIAIEMDISLPVIIGLCTVNSIFEESVVVGYVIRSMENHGPLFAIGMSLLLRFTYHTYQGPMAIVSIVPLGVLFGIVYWRWRKLWPLIFAHGMMNFISFTTFNS